MTKPTLADVLASLKSLTSELQYMKAEVIALKEKSDSTSDNGGRRRSDGMRDPDPPPQHKKWDFPRFDGTTDPMLFLNKCEAYFRQHRTMAEERVGRASYHMDDIAQLWYTQLQEDEGRPTWGRFKELLNLRFGPPLRSAPMFELAECRRSSTVEEYANRFQALLPRAGRLDEAQRVQLFTGGLLPPLSHAVRIHGPETLVAAMSLAWQVELMESERPAQQPRAPSRGQPSAYTPRAALPATPPLMAHSAPLVVAEQGRDEGNQRRLTPDEMAERRRQNLCFNCNERYTRGHNRFCKRLFFIEGVEIDDAIDSSAAAAADTGETDAPIFSLHAVAGVSMGKTMQIRVVVGATTLIALLDTGSTHNFIAEEAARRSGLPILPRPRLTATVANGDKVPCPGVIRHAPITINNFSFAVDLFVLPLAGYDLVLGTQWMENLGRLTWDFTAGTVSFVRQGRTICWAGVPLLEAAESCAAATSAPLLDELLAGFGDVFREPQGLPPTRNCDHAITLKPDAQPVAVRPYRYPAAHKDEMERQCAAMITQGIVRRSVSAFSSPVLLVKKADGAWRFCVDYRALNALTIKDAFPIPVVDELLDELHGARFFTKLDLRSEYHQVRMQPDDIHKTAF
ncbi:uncharacterized protein [Zea mays]|uniref:uncharacterized protein isoform X1 n=1 Tax=Zea mays TaxID=4577 RepID=UPI0016522092|nr:uncharacterized protein LOC100284057 isoform X1 [Zea mays]XP_035823521.1 uncharacterized protein LOC100284057 isoform X1 [Zea mays]